MRSRMWVWDDIPLRDFVKVWCDGNRNRLYIGGTRPKRPDTSLEDEVADELSLRFTEAIRGTEETTSVLASIRKMESARLNVIILACASHIMRTGRADENIGKALRQLNIRLSGDKGRDTALVESKLNEAIRKFGKADEEYRSGDSGKTAADASFFTGALVTMSAWFKFVIQDNITAAQFCEYHRQMTDGMRQQRKSINKTKNHKGTY